MKNLNTNKLMWWGIIILSFLVAGAGVVDQKIYSKVMANDLMPGAIAQDLLTIIVTLGLAWLVAITKKTDTKKQLIIMGITGSLGYLYAIFAIERIYNWFYLAYLGIMGLVLYGLPYSIASMDFSEKWQLPKLLKWISICFSLFIGILFCFLWIGSLIPAMKTGQKIELYYSIYILDLIWVMPGFISTAILLWKNKSAGVLLTPAMYILGIFVIFPLGLGELAKPFYGMPIKTDSMQMSFLLSAAFFILAIWQLIKMKKA